MLETSFSFQLDIGEVLDFDLDGAGLPLTIQGYHQNQILRWSETRLALPPDWSNPEYPHIRYLNKGRAVVVDTSRGAGGEANAWIIHQNGRITKSLNIGTGASDIVGFAGGFAVAYHKDSALLQGLAVHARALGGVAFFDLEGEFRFSLNRVLSGSGAAIENVGAIASYGPGRLLVVPEVLIQGTEQIEFPFLIFDILQKQFSWIPSPFVDPLAVSARDSHIFAYSPVDWEDRVLAFDTQLETWQTLSDSMSNIFRGLEGGRFLAQHSESTYSIIQAEPPPPAPKSRGVGRSVVRSIRSIRS